MKLIRWVEVHIGRSRRKTKKEKDSGLDGKTPTCTVTDVPKRRDESTPSTPLRKVEPVGRRDFPAPLSADSTPRRSPGPPGTPGGRSSGRHSLHIRTSFLEPPSPDSGSPRQRSRIRTNPWLPSPRGGSPSLSGRQPWEEPLRANRLPRVTLRDTPDAPINADRQIFNVSRPIPRSAWVDFRTLNAETNQQDATNESSDEAYAEDYEDDDDEEEEERPSQKASLEVKEAGSPQADSACGSDRDNSGSSCSTTPLSEVAGCRRTLGPSTSVTREPLCEKVERLRAERRHVDRRLAEAREEEITRREERLALHRELVQFRRLLLLQTLTDLREQLERRDQRRVARLVSERL